MTETKRKIEIMDGMYTIKEERVVAQGCEQDIMPIIQNQMATQPVFIPHRDGGCAMYVQSGLRKCFLMHLEPKSRLIKYFNEATRRRNVFSVITPHIYIAIFFRNRAIEGGYALVAKEKVASAGSKLGCAPLPNISTPLGLICEGQRGMWTTDRDPKDVCLSYIDYFFESDFTSHINSHCELVPTELKPGERPKDDFYSWNESYFNKWQGFSRDRNVEDVLALNWITDLTVDKVIEGAWKEGQ